MSPVFVLRSHPDSADLTFRFQNPPPIIITCSNLNDIVEDKNSLAHKVHNLHLTGKDNVDDNVSFAQ